MTVNSIKGGIGCEERMKSCPCDVIHMERGKAVITYPAGFRMYCSLDAIEMSPMKSNPIVVPWG